MPQTITRSPSSAVLQIRYQQHAVPQSNLGGISIIRINTIFDLENFQWFGSNYRCESSDERPHACVYVFTRAAKPAPDYRAGPVPEYGAESVPEYGTDRINQNWSTEPNQYRSTESNQLLNTGTDPAPEYTEPNQYFSTEPNK